MGDLEWECVIYGHPNDPCGDDVDAYGDRLVGTRYEAMEWANALAKQHKGYYVNVSLVSDGFDNYSAGRE